jgi:hypothetical protein
MYLWSHSNESVTTDYVLQSWKKMRTPRKQVMLE